MALAPVALPPSVGQGRAPAAYGSAGSSASSSGQRQGRGSYRKGGFMTWHEGVARREGKLDEIGVI